MFKIGAMEEQAARFIGDNGKLFGDMANFLRSAKVIGTTVNKQGTELGVVVGRYGRKIELKFLACDGASKSEICLEVIRIWRIPLGRERHLAFYIADHLSNFFGCKPIFDSIWDAAYEGKGKAEKVRTERKVYGNLRRAEGFLRAAKKDGAKTAEIRKAMRKLMRELDAQDAVQEVHEK